MSLSAIPVASVSDARSTISSALNVPPADTRSDDCRALVGALVCAHAATTAARTTMVETRARFIGQTMRSWRLGPLGANPTPGGEPSRRRDVHLQPRHAVVRVVHDRPDRRRGPAV